MKIRLALLLAIALVALGGTASAAPKYAGIYYGNWGGPNWSAGRHNAKPTDTAPWVDDLDMACYRHDMAYAAADRVYRGAYQTANPVRKVLIYALWRAAYRVADVSLGYAAAKLPLLTWDKAGNDSWHGRNVPYSFVLREAYRKGVVLAAIGGLYFPPKP